jgi:Tol biopolymer transport system component
MLAAVLAALSLTGAAPAAAQHPIASPVWSFDGARIAWAEASGAGQHEIWAANADGTNQHRIAPGIDSLFEFAWLPSGDFLYDANYRLFRVGSDGHPRPVGSGVTFSVDRKGALVAYQTADLCPSCHGPIEVRSLSSGKTWRIAAAGQNLFPALSPDGTRVAFTRFLSSGKGRYEKQGGIWIASSRGGTPVQRTTTGSCPQWSPDGRRLTYADASGLHLIDRTGGVGTLLLRGGNLPACSVAWAPDGKHVAAATSHGRLLVIDPATRASHPIGPTHSLSFVWAPDGSRLLVTGGATGQSCPALWSVKPDGSALRRIRGC